MFDSDLPDEKLLETVLCPLLEDFQYWFSRSQELLETENIHFLSPEEQASLLERVRQARQKVAVTEMMFRATGGKVGVAMEVLMPWHRLLVECWQVSMQFRSARARASFQKEEG